MPKQKTRKSLSKRFKITKTGKVMRACSGRSHLLSGKTAKRKRQLRKSSQTSGKRAAVVRKLA
ncbi:MAG: 50S ribosomal protein L35 [Planctomycetia bacterium]|nr:50S ribosomal protein L35 [Planctomycetia bacterium]